MIFLHEKKSFLGTRAGESPGKGAIGSGLPAGPVLWEPLGGPTLGSTDKQG